MFLLQTCASGWSEPIEAAPSLTTSASLDIVFIAFWAADARASWLLAAPATKVFVSSTNSLAVFSIASL